MGTAYTKMLSDNSMETNTLNRFETNECSSVYLNSTTHMDVFGNGTLSHPNLFLDCCVQHNLDYWKGGTEIERFLSDKQLKICIEDTKQLEIARLMYEAVREKGNLETLDDLKYYWGYGWRKKREYGKLSSDEQMQVGMLKPSQKDIMQRIDELRVSSKQSTVSEDTNTLSLDTVATLSNVGF